MPRIAIRNPGRHQIVIDDTYENLCLRFKASYTATSSGDHVFDITIPILDGMPPVIALRPLGDSFYISVLATSVSGSNITFKIGVTPYLAGTFSRVVEYFVLDLSNSVSAPKGHVMMRNRLTGRVTFNSAHKYLKILQFAYSATETIHGPYSFAGRKLAVVFGKSTWSVTTTVADTNGRPPGSQGASPPWWVTTRVNQTGVRKEGEIFHLTNANYVTREYWPFATPPANSFFFSNGGNAMIIDVTNY